jgi:GGDEF domain-containing protein
LHEPRTGLPTGPLIDEELSRRRQSHDPYVELVLMLDGFTEYADVYGFMAGDEVISYAAKTIQQAVSTLGTSDDFVGIADNEFVLLTHTSDAARLEDGIKNKFDDGIRAFYSFLDADRGGILINAGSDDERLVPLMSIHASALART